MPRVNIIFVTKMSERIVFEERNTAFRRRLLTFAVVNVEHIDIREFLKDAFHHFEEQISLLIEDNTLVKVNAVFKSVFFQI